MRPLTELLGMLKAPLESHRGVRSEPRSMIGAGVCGDDTPT